jgi:peptide/nickel transport system substrate-binding protein
MFYEHLVTFGPSGNVRPELATSLGRPNRVTYIFHLRHGVKFWDGNEMTSADVVNSLDYERLPTSEVAIDYADVKNIKATNRYTVVITLREPDPGFKYTLAYPGVIFEKKYQDEHPTTMGSPTVLIQATGPWKIDSFDPTTGMQLSPNPHWWGGKVPFQHISVSFFASETSEALAMRAGEIDVAFPVGGPAFAAASGLKVLNWLPTTGYSLGYFGMNTKLKQWRDVHVRRAVAYALNRKAIIVGNGGPSSATSVSTFIPPGALRTLGSRARVDRLLKSVPQYPFNLAKAKQEMAESAYPKGFTDVDYAVNFGAWVNVVEVIAAELQKIGIDLKVDVLPLGQWVSMVYGPHNFTNLFAAVGFANPDPSAEPGYLLGSKNAKPGGLNWADYTPKSVDELIARSLSSTNPTTRLAIYGLLMKKVATDVPYVPLYIGDGFAALSSKVTVAPGDVGQFEAQSNLGSWALYVRPSV